jgi:hypothetical protein
MRVTLQHNVCRYRRTCITGVGLHRRLPASSQFDLDVVGVAQDDEGTPALSIYVLNTRMRQSEWRDPNNKTALSDLGPAFFTKYLYFAGVGCADHRCCILDENVAMSLHRTCGWASLPTKNWLATAYGGYALLLDRWIDEYRLPRRDLVARWFFENGKTLERSG